MRRLIQLLLLALAIGTAAPGALLTQTASPPPLPLDPAIRWGRLPGGLTFYIRHNGRPANRAELRLVINAGSVLEEESERGLAHFLEHMAFNGTERFRKQELVTYLESIGVRMGADLNASTGFDETIYQLQVPTDRPAFMEKAFDILEDWSHSIALEEDEIDRERGVIIEEWRLGRGAHARVRDRQLPILLRNSRYAERLPIGTRENLESFHPDTLRAFYRKWYRPDLMAVIAVGDFNPDTVAALIRKRFGGPVPRAGSPPRPVFPVPDHADTLFSLVTDPEMDLTSVGITVKLPPLPEGSEEDYRRSLAMQLAETMFNQRAAELTRTSAPPFLMAYAGRGRFVRTKDSFTASAIVREGGAATGLVALAAELERVRQHGFTQGELDRAKADLLRALEQAHQEREKTESGSLAEEYARNFLYGEPVPGIAAEYALARTLLPALPLQEVTALWLSCQTPENVVITVSAPERTSSPLPEAALLRALLDSVCRSPLLPYVDATAERPLLAPPPSPGTVRSRRLIPEIGVTELALSNGVRVCLKPTDFKNDEVLVAGFSEGGTSLAPTDRHIAAVTATSVVQEGGLGDFDRNQLTRLLAGKLASASAIIGELEEGISAQASPRDLETMFQLIYLRFTSPRKDTTAFHAYVTRMRGMIENRSARPESALDDTLQVTLARYHPRRQPVTVKTMNALDLEWSYRFYQERFADASGFAFVVVGAFSPDSIAPLILTYLGGLPSAFREERWRDIGVRIPGGVIRKEIRAGIEQKAQARLVFTGDFAWSQENRTRFNALAEVLRIKLRQNVREEKGGSYGVSVGGAPVRYPKGQYRLTVAFGCAPDRVQELLGAVMATIDTLRTVGPDPQSLASVKESFRRSRETSLKQNSFWLGALQLLISNGEDPLTILEFDRRVAALDISSLQEAARTYLDPSRYVQCVLLPEGARP
jgi:zinc protease